MLSTSALSFSLALLALLAVAYADDGSPLTKVVALLEDLKKQLEQNGAEEAQLYNEYNQWCDSETMENKNALSNLKAKFDDLNAVLQEQQALRNQLDSEIEEAGNDLASKEADLKGAQEMRDKEHSDYKSSFQVYENSIDELASASEVLATKAPGTSLVQVASAVRHALQRSPNLPLNDMEQQILGSFLQQSSLGNQGVAGSNVLAPDVPIGFLQMSRPTDDAVLDVLQKIKANQEGNRDKALTDEQAAKSNFESLKASLEDAIRSFQTEMDTKKSQKAESEESSARSQAQLEQTNQNLRETANYLQEVTSQCEQKAREWKERTKLRSDEITAVSEAVRIMTSEAAQGLNEIDPRQQGMMFLQTSMRVSMKRNLDVGQAVTNILQQSGSRVLSLLAGRVQARMAAGTAMSTADPFYDVRKMVQEMIDRLMKEAAEEAEHKEFCDTEMAKSSKQKTLKEAEIKKQSARIQEMEAAVAELTDELEQLTHSMADMEAMINEATDIRQKEKGEALVSIKQYQDAQSLIGSATTVLQEFYSKHESMVQTGSSWSAGYSTDASFNSPPPATWSDNNLSAKDGTASGIIGLLQIAQSDFARLESETSTAEAVAEREYTNLLQENQAKKAEVTKSVEYKSDEKTKMESSIQRAKSDLEGFQKELDAVNEYIEKLTPECTEQTESYEERKARREQEIQSLKEALGILEGNSV